MDSRKKLAVLAGWFVLVSAAGPVSRAGAENWYALPPFEGSAYGFVSEADDATAIFLNPGGLAGGHGTNLYMDLSGNQDEIIEGVVGLQGGSWGFTYRHQDLKDRSGAVPLSGFVGPGNDANLDTYVLAWSYGQPALQAGAARVWSNVDLPGDDASAWHIGFQSRVSRRISLGGAVENANKPKFLDGRLRPRYSYGFSLRLVPSDPELLTLSVQGSHDDGSPDLIDMAYGVRFHLQTGMEFGVSVQAPQGDDPYFGGWVTSHFGRGAVSAKARAVRGEDFRTLVSAQAFDQFWQRSMAGRKKVATLDLDGSYEDEGGFVLLGSDTRSSLDLVRRIEHAGQDKDVRALALRLGNVSGAFIGPVRAQHEEIRKAILDFRDEGKPVVAFLDGIAGPSEIYLASAADEIVMPPLSGVQGIGVSLHLRRYKRMLEKLGIGWNADTAGKYKSSFHGWYTDSTTADQAEEIQGLVDAAYDHLVTTIQDSRNISAANMAEIGTGRILFPEECLSTGLVDRVGWWDDALREADRLSGGEGKMPETMTLPARSYWSQRWTPPPAVAVVPAYGGIQSGTSSRDWIRGGWSMGSRTVVRQLKAAASYPGVRAIVLRVDSGGGSALASEEIRHQILKIKKERNIPIYVSMGSMAASGGYWIAMDGDSVFANHTTLTGSIGVVWSLPVFEGLYEKLAVTSETYKRGEHTDMLSYNRYATPEERVMLSASLDYIYDAFVAGVAEGRGLPEDRVREIAQGRVYLGDEALRLGLVDGVSGLDEVVRIAASRTKIQDDYGVLTFRPGGKGLVEKALGYVGRAGSGLLGWMAPGGDGIEVTAER